VETPFFSLSKRHGRFHFLYWEVSSPPALHAKYAALLPNADFQKGCINVKSVSALSLPILKQLYGECAKVDIAAMLAARKKKK
jgi:hypothetical protein